jgi:hypothetical protein
MRARSRLVVAAAGVAAAALALLGYARPAAAYPQFQFSSGTKTCGQCHYSPAGTGLISAWGRDEAGDTLSTAGGDGAFLHGLWTPPSWLALGGDLRLAGIRNDVGGPESPEWAAFPMQADLYLRAAYEGFSLNVIVGDRGVVRPVDPSLGGRAGDAVDRFMSREHYLMWRPSATGPYARVGRFFAPYGLRLVEHIFFVRRYTGYNLYEETYNVSGGYVEDGWELHITGFAPTPRSPAFFGGVGAREAGFAAYGEKRLGGVAALALQTRLGVASDEARFQFGGVGKAWVDAANLLFLGEADFIRQSLASGSFSRWQFVSYASATYIPVKGLYIGAIYERFQEDLGLSTTGRNAYDLELNFFPYAHFEVVLLGRYQRAVDAPSQASSSATLGMLQLHYYL